MTKSNYFSNSLKGYVLVEAVVAVTIIVVGLLGMFSLLSQSLALNRVVTERYVAAHLAVEGIEIVKNIIDNNVINGRAWNDGLSSGEYEADYNDLSLKPYSGRSLLFDKDNGFYNYQSGETTRYKRLIKVQQLGNGEELKVNSIVNWVSRGNAQFKVDLESRFFNWR